MGAKGFTEQYVLAEIYRQLIEAHTALRVVTKTGFGGTQLIFNALRSGAIDFYPEYTGTGLLVILQPAPAVVTSLNGDPDRVYDYVKTEFSQRYGLTWLAPLGFNNAYCLMMREPQARSLGIRTISELTQYLNQPPP